MFDEGMEGGYFLKRPDGSVWQVGYVAAGHGNRRLYQPGGKEMVSEETRSIG